MREEVGHVNLGRDRQSGDSERCSTTMGWEERRGRKYFYRKRRNGGRVVSEYLGAGPDAVDQACHLIRTLVDAVLLLNGYHTHKGQWRKKRE